MRYQGALFLLLALFAAGQVAGQELTAGTTLSKPAISNQTIHWLAPERSEKTSAFRRSVGGLSPQAWTTQVGWNVGVSAFPDDTTHGWRMCLLWGGHKPWHHELITVARQ
jgi:hypothetical protein